MCPFWNSQDLNPSLKKIISVKTPVSRRMSQSNRVNNQKLILLKLYARSRAPLGCTIALHLEKINCGTSFPNHVNVLKNTCKRPLLKCNCYQTPSKRTFAGRLGMSWSLRWWVVCHQYTTRTKFVQFVLFVLMKFGYLIWFHWFWNDPIRTSRGSRRALREFFVETARCCPVPMSCA